MEITQIESMNTFRVIVNQLDELRKLSGNAQISYLSCIKSDLLKEILEYTYDTHRKYKIDEGKYNKLDNITHWNRCEFNIDDWNCFKGILDNLNSIKSAKDTDVKKVVEFISDYLFEYEEFLKMILFKDLRLNMSIKKFQKVWSDFCILYPYMGCRPFNMKNLESLSYPAYAQTKMDGTFCNVIVNPFNKTVEYISRQSKPQKMAGSLDTEFLKINLSEKFVFTGEALVWDSDRKRPLPRKLGNGILRRDFKTQDELDRVFFVCWDCLPYENFIEKKWDVPYTERFEKLCYYFEQTDLKKLQTVNTWVVNSYDEVMAKFQEQYESGEEGIVVKSFNQIWQDGKPSGQVKIKAEKDCDLKMIEFIEGKGNYAGMCGAIKCVSKDNLLEVMVKPRTPLDASEIWQNQQKYLNKILTIKYNEKITSDLKDKISLYLPVFVEIRDDKYEADLLCQIE